MNQKPKPKPTLPKAALPPSATKAANSAAAPVRSRLEDWAATEEDDFDYYVGEKRQRGGRKKRKKKREPQMGMQNWDDIYDPSRPNNYEEYRHSDEKILEVREWKDRLYAHRMIRSPTPDSDSDYDRPMNRMHSLCYSEDLLSGILTESLQVNLLPPEALRHRRTSMIFHLHLQQISPMTHPERMHLHVAHA